MINTTNLLNAAIGYNQQLEMLMQAKDVDGALGLFTDKKEQVEAAIKEYNVATHRIMSREDKILKNAKGDRTGVLERWKLPLSYPEYINEIALVFLYGQPVLWSNDTEGNEAAFTAYTQLLKRLHFDSKVRQCKRYAGSETQSAMLFRVFRNSEGKADCQIRVLAASKGDKLYAQWDIYENLTAFAWGYQVKEADGETCRHVDLYTPATCYFCRLASSGWEVNAQKNPVGKIPVILFEQQKEWHGVERLIEREEYIGSRTADTNDYFADPMFFVSADIIKNMPEKDTENKTFVFKNADEAQKQAFFLTWDSAPESKKQEIDWLHEHILSKSFTPDISFEQMKGLGNVSGRALKQIMTLANIKAAKQKERHDEYMSRVSSLCLAIIGNVLDVSLASECKALSVGHTFQDPFGDDIAAAIDNIVKARDAEILSQERAVELNPLVRDKDLELARIQQENEAQAASQRDLFGTNQTADDVYGGAE